VRRYILELFDIKFSGSTLEELAQHERQALEDLKLGGAGVLSLRHIHGHGHHSNGTRKLRHSIRAKARRRSDADFRNIGGHANDAHHWNSSGVPDSPAVVRAKPDVPKMIGFDAILDDTMTPIIVQGG
jgi:hypothetical protein